MSKRAQETIVRRITLTQHTRFDLAHLSDGWYLRIQQKLPYAMTRQEISFGPYPTRAVARAVRKTVRSNLQLAEDR